MCDFGDASRACNHMNVDHKESIVAWAAHYLGIGGIDVSLLDADEGGEPMSVEG